MNNLLKTLAVVATGALLATSAFAQSAGVLTAQTVTFKSPGK